MVSQSLSVHKISLLWISVLLIAGAGKAEPVIHERGLGPVMIGMKFEENLADLQWGEPDRVYMGDDQIVVAFEAEGVSFTYRISKEDAKRADAINNSILTEITINSPFYVDEEGRGVGQPCFERRHCCQPGFPCICYDCADDGFIKRIRIRSSQKNEETVSQGD